MAQIPPIEDAYIDDIIKSAEPYDSTLNKTQGVKVRELMKKMRDRMDQGSSAAIAVTYAQLGVLITNSTLVVGQQYLLTDFRSTFTYAKYSYSSTYANLSPGSEVYSGNVEPLILMAIDINKLSSLAFSTVYPGDEIMYTYQNKNGGIHSSTKGTILSREDKIMLAYANFDWREAKYKYTDSVTGLEVIETSLTFTANEWGVSNSRVFANGYYGTIGPLVIRSVYNSFVRSSGYSVVVLASVYNSRVEDCMIINRSCTLRNTILLSVLTGYYGDHPIAFEGLTASLTGHSALSPTQFESLKYNGLASYLSFNVVEGINTTVPSSGMAKVYKQYVDEQGIFQTTPV